MTKDICFEKRGDNRATWIAIASYVLLVIVIWGYYGTRNGMDYETTFMIDSDQRPLMDSFWYHADPLRGLNSFFYHVSYLLSVLMGIRGSFLPFQLVYALLWMGRGIFAFLVVRRLIPRFEIFAYLVGTLVIVHASDAHLNWVGQMNQYGFIFAMLVCFYLLICALQASNMIVCVGFAAGSALFSFMTVWAHPSPIFVVLAFPVLLVAFWVRLTWRRILALAIYLLPSLYFVYLSIDRYFPYRADHPVSYGSGLMRPDLTPQSLVHDLWFNVYHSLGFWLWNKTLSPFDLPTALVAITVGGAVGLFVLSFTLILRQRKASSALIPPRTDLAKLAICGGVFLLLSIPAYIITVDATSLIRTQFLSGFGASLLLACAIALAASFVSDQRARRIALAGCTAVVVGFGALASIKTGSHLHTNWEAHRRVIAQVLDVVPRIKENALVVLTDVPKVTPQGGGIFGHNLWFAAAVYLCYPDTAVKTGIFFYDDETPAPGMPLVLEGEHWVRTEGPAMLVPLDRFSITDTVIIRYDIDGDSTVLDSLPDSWTDDEHVRQLYDPHSVILPGPPSSLAVRRYQPIGE